MLDAPPPPAWNAREPALSLLSNGILFESTSDRLAVSGDTNIPLMDFSRAPGVEVAPLNVPAFVLGRMVSAWLAVVVIIGSEAKGSFNPPSPLLALGSVIVLFSSVIRWPLVYSETDDPSRVTPRTPGCTAVPDATLTALVAAVMLEPATVVIKGSVVDWDGIDAVPGLITGDDKLKDARLFGMVIAGPFGVEMAPATSTLFGPMVTVWPVTEVIIGLEISESKAGDISLVLLNGTDRSKDSEVAELGIDGASDIKFVPAMEIS